MLKAFSIFEVTAIPSARIPGFKDYGDGYIKLLAEHLIVKPKLHNRLKNEPHLQVLSNGPWVESDACTKIVLST